MKCTFYQKLLFTEIIVGYLSKLCSDLTHGFLLSSDIRSEGSIAIVKKLTSVFWWFFTFERHIYNFPRIGRSHTARTPDNVQHINNLILADKPKTSKELSLQVGLKEASICRIVKQFQFKEVWARRIPKMSNIHKETRKAVCSVLLEQYENVVWLSGKNNDGRWNLAAPFLNQTPRGNEWNGIMKKNKERKERKKKSKRKKKRRKKKNTFYQRSCNNLSQNHYISNF